MTHNKLNFDCFLVCCATPYSIGLNNYKKHKLHYNHVQYTIHVTISPLHVLYIKCTIFNCLFGDCMREWGKILVDTIF